MKQHPAMNKEPFDLERYEKVTPRVTLTWRGKPISFYVPTTFVLWRATSFETKEPDTVAWLSSFKPEEIYFDIGANVGMYAIAAAAAMDVSVYAFEPEAANYAILTRNIYDNRLCGKMKAYCIALSDETTLGDFFIANHEQGSSGHMFGEDLDFNLQSKKSDLIQGSVSFKLDELIQKNMLPVPNHIKIDVDGLEHKILDGAAETIENETVKSVLVELNTNLEIHRSIISRMESVGFALDQEQVDASIIKGGWNAGLGNHIFRR